ncbi:MAG TPA: RHS repeat-associated core domain-containing protein [Chitinophagaceae bacterium]|nr:RHS repeat-associated core domain-containing protein [Chitinophagaceae bacterium]
MGDPYKYKFGGKELQDELNLNWHDHGARNYDAAIGRWLSPDPLAEEFPEWSPYNFVENSPLVLIDPTGMGPEDIRIYGKDANGEDQLLVNLKTDEIDIDVHTNIPSSLVQTMDPITNEMSEGIEIDIDPLLPDLSNVPADSNVMISVGLEATLGVGFSTSIDAVLFQNDEGVVDAVAAFKTTGDTKGAYGGGGVQVGVMTSKSGNPLKVNDFGGSSKSFSAALKFGGSFVFAQNYSGLLVDVPNTGNAAGISVSNNSSVLTGGSGNVEKYHEEE